LGSVTRNRRLFTGSVVATGTRRYTVELTTGTYAYACSAHPQTMHGTFIVVAKT
jgi:plastocyanin